MTRSTLIKARWRTMTMVMLKVRLALIWQRIRFILSLSPFFSAQWIMSKMKVIAMKQSAVHRLTRITLEAGVRRFENLQNFLISRKLPPIQITVTMTLMLIKMLRCRSGFRQNMSKELLEFLQGKFLNVAFSIWVCRLQTCSVATDWTQRRSVLATSVSLYIYTFLLRCHYPIFTPFWAFVLKY